MPGVRRAPRGAGRVLRLTVAAPRCPPIAGSLGLPAHSAPVFYAAARARRPSAPVTPCLRANERRGNRPLAGWAAKGQRSLLFQRQRLRDSKYAGTLALEEAGAGRGMGGGIKDPHRVSRETEAPGDGRAPGRGAGQPQHVSRPAPAGTEPRTHQPQHYQSWRNSAGMGRFVASRGRCFRRPREYCFN